jgi:hypothetical protein
MTFSTWYKIPSGLSTRAIIRKEPVDFFCARHRKEAVQADMDSGNVRVLSAGDALVGAGSRKNNRITRQFYHAAAGRQDREGIREALSDSSQTARAVTVPLYSGGGTPLKAPRTIKADPELTAA